MPNDEVPSKAAAWLAAMILAEDRSSLLPQLPTWLGEDPSHQCAFEDVMRAWRLLAPFLRATQPGGGPDEINAFFDAVDEEKARSPKAFAHA
jgi:ferric-dicitrate binding protein FerR (iron transport regulator)